MLKQETDDLFFAILSERSFQCSKYCQVLIYQLQLLSTDLDQVNTFVDSPIWTFGLYDHSFLEYALLKKDTSFPSVREIKPMSTIAIKDFSLK